MKKVTNRDIGGGGSKNWHFHGDIIFDLPLINMPLEPEQYICSQLC